MVKNMLLRAAAVFEGPFGAFLEIVSVFMALSTLMLLYTPYLPFPFYFLYFVLAYILTIMTLEDADEQTIDIRLLSILGVCFYFMADYSGRGGVFFVLFLFGVMFFRLLLLILSLWTTFRTPIEKSLSKIGIVDECEDRIGYLPVFMIVFCLFLGFDSESFPIFYEEIDSMVVFLEDLFLYIPEFYIVILLLWLAMEWFCWRRERSGKAVRWAFGGGDVLFLGLFTGYLGVSSLLLLFFFSLFVLIWLYSVRYRLREKYGNCLRQECD